MNSESLAKITAARQAIANCIADARADIEKGNTLDVDTTALSRRRAEANVELQALAKSTEPDAAAALDLAAIKTTAASIATLRAEIAVLDNAISGREKKAADFLREANNRGNAIADDVRDALWSSGSTLAGFRMEQLWEVISGWPGAPATIPAVFKDDPNSALVTVANQDPLVQQYARVWREISSVIGYGANAESFLPYFVKALELVEETETLFSPPAPASPSSARASDRPTGPAPVAAGLVTA